MALVTVVISFVTEKTVTKKMTKGHVLYMELSEEVLMYFGDQVELAIILT
jgi:hypothetical protein